MRLFRGIRRSCLKSRGHRRLYRSRLRGRRSFRHNPCPWRRRPRQRHVAGREEFRSVARGSLQGADARRGPEAFDLFQCAEGSGNESHGPGGVTGMRQDGAVRVRPGRPIATPLTPTLSPLTRGEGVASPRLSPIARARRRSGFGGAVADAGLGFDNSRRGRVALDFGAQLTDEHAQILRVLAMRRTPNRGQNLAVRHYLAGVTKQHGEQVVFFRRQLDRRPSRVTSRRSKSMATPSISMR